MIKGIGIDIVEIQRIRKAYERQPKFAHRILTVNEINKFMSLPNKRRMEYLAGRFAAKEAYSKAVGTGIGRDLSFLDMEVAKDINGKPFFLKPAEYGVHLSITHSKDYAFAQVIIEHVDEK